MLHCSECEESSTSRYDMFDHIQKKHCHKVGGDSTGAAVWAKNKPENEDSEYLENNPDKGIDAEVNENASSAASKIDKFKFGAMGKSRKEALKEFLKSHVNDNGDRYECTKCGESHKSLKEMYLHVLTVHCPGDETT